MSTVSNDRILAAIERIAADKFDGHFTVMRFTTDWKVQFGVQPQDRDEIEAMPTGDTLLDAFFAAINDAF
jgi:hypothetical protein